MSADLTTAVAEYEQEIGIRPGTFCAYDLVSSDIVDLCDDTALAASGIDPSIRLAPWKSILLVDGKRPPGWDIADTLIAAGIAGILVPSARRPIGINLVLWRWNDSPTRRLAALDPNTDLPRDQRSWPTVAPLPQDG
jgi:RES domain-containing protein